MKNDNNRGFGVIFETGIDILLNFSALMMAYMLAAPIITPAVILPDSPVLMTTVFIIVVVQSLSFLSLNVYKPIPFIKTEQALKSIMRVNIVYFLLVEVVCAMVFVGAEDNDFVLLWIGFSAIISTAILLFKKRMIIRFIKFFRRGRFNLRRAIIVGDNTASAQAFLRQLSDDVASGMIVIGYVGDKISLDDGDCPKLGVYKDLATILDEHKPTDVIFAIDSYNKKSIIRLVNLCDDRCIKVYFLPVIYGFFKSPRQIESIGTLPIINAHSTPLDNRFNAFLKRVIDIFGSLALIILTSPIMLVAAIGVKISSPGPILFKQTRVGKMGKNFTMYKFRSMRVNVESDEYWSNEEDPRKTKFGAFIRRTSIDELPQLFNVLFGSMSLVGPRPEIPHFVEYFKDRIPLYMVKHYVKPGMTGLAQVRGLRGDTSVEDRIHADIEYIENWSLGMDILILLKTPFKAINKAEKYVAPKPEEETEVTEEMTDEENITDEEIVSAPTPDQLAETVSEGKTGGLRILYCASVMIHINNFHLGYIERLREEGHTVKVMARGDGADYNVPFEKKFFSAANTACRAEIRKIIEREKFDVIILNTSLAAFHIRFALPKKDRPRVVNIVHGYLFSEHTGFFKRNMLLMVEKLVASRTDAIIVMNEDDRKIAEKHKLCLGKVYYSRGMGASVRSVITEPSTLRRELLCQDKYVLAFVGELSARKNQAFLIRSLNAIKERIPNAVLWLVGDGNDRATLERLAGEVDLSSSVMFLGSRVDACDLMRASDLYVSASMIEGMPFNIIEAMGCGKTILASRIKGHADLIDEGTTGFMFKYNNSAEFVQKVVAIHDGLLKVDIQDVLDRYSMYANEKVFSETYEVIKESMTDV